MSFPIYLIKWYNTTFESSEDILFDTYGIQTLLRNDKLDFHVSDRNRTLATGLLIQKTFIFRKFVRRMHQMFALTLIC